LHNTLTAFGRQSTGRKVKLRDLQASAGFQFGRVPAQDPFAVRPQSAVEHVFRGKHLLAFVQDRVPGHYFIFYRAQDQADGRIVIRATLDRL
jgi:hypothetical protein